MKFLVTAVCLVLLHTAGAQVRVGLEAGGQFTFLSPRKDLGINSGSAVVPAGGISLQIGSGSFDHIMDAPLGKAFFLETGLFLTNFKYQNTNVQVYNTETGNDLGRVKTHNLTYLHIPVNYLRKFKAGKGRIIVGGGFFGAFNIAEKITLENSPQITTENAAVIGTKGPNNLVAGLTTKFGVESGKMYSYLFFQRTMTSIFEKNNGGSAWHGYMAGLRLGWMIK